MNRTVTDGECPLCGGTDLAYGDWCLDGESGYYETDCENCGQTLKTYYALTFIGYYHVDSNNDFFLADENIPKKEKT